MIDSYDTCDECGLEIIDNHPVKGIIHGHHVNFCCWKCFNKYEKEINREGGENYDEQI